MFDFSNLFCCNPNCPCRQNDRDGNSGNEPRIGENANGVNNDCFCRNNNRPRPNSPRVIVGPRGPRGYTGATGATGADGSISSSTAVLSSATTAVTQTIALTTTEVLQNAYLPLNTEVQDGGNFITLNDDNTFTITKQGYYLVVFTVQLDTASTATANTVTLTINDSNGVIYGYLSRVDSDRNIPFIGNGYINVESVSNKYALVNASSNTITVAPLSDGNGIEIRPSVQISITKLN